MDEIIKLELELDIPLTETTGSKEDEIMLSWADGNSTVTIIYYLEGMESEYDIEGTVIPASWSIGKIFPGETKIDACPLYSV